MYTVILLWHVSGCGPLSLNQINKKNADHNIKTITYVLFFISINFKTSALQPQT